MFRHQKNFCAILLQALQNTNFLGSSGPTLKTEKEQTLEDVIAKMQKRGGDKALRQGLARGEVVYLATGFSALDTVLNGGVPRGRLTHLEGRPTSGMTTLALSIMAAAQRQNEPVIYLDTRATFDPDHAVRYGVNVADLLIVRSDAPDEALGILFDVLNSHLPGVVVLNAVGLPGKAKAKLEAALHRSASTLTASQCVLLVLTYPQPERLPLAALHLRVEHQGWIRQGKDVRGYRAVVKVLKRSGGAGEQVSIDILLGNHQPGDAA